MITWIQRTVLLIDDDPFFSEGMETLFHKEQYNFCKANNCSRGLEICNTRKVDVAILDQKLPDGNGYELCQDILKANESCKIIFITAYPDFSHARQALNAGAFDYLCKPFDAEELILAVNKAIRTLNLEGVHVFEKFKSHREQAASVLIGESEAMKQAVEIIRLSSNSDAPVLITGETGTGKNVVAKAIHLASEHREAPFIDVNCAALPEGLIEDELFGHEKGAFSGAGSLRRGLFEIAEGGSLLLDEIGAMPLNLQAKLLSVLDSGIIRRLGGESSRQVQARIVAATNNNLEESVQQKSFREDLFFRLAVIRIELPPLRERKEDIPLLCKHFINQLSCGRSNSLEPQELNALLDYSWPGNIRELKNVLERAIILCKGQPRPSLYLPQVSADFDNTESTPPTLPALPLHEVERQHIVRTFQEFHGNLSRCARVLDISLSTMKRKAREYNLIQKSGE